MHIPVLMNEVLAAMAVAPGGRYIDGTLGQAGHSCAIMKLAGAEGALLGIDRDAEALPRAAKHLEAVPGRHVLVQGEHGDLKALAEANGFTQVNGILLDLGVSSDQLDTGRRGFSFRLEGPLDMRMGQTSGDTTAADYVATMDVSKLARCFRELGEEPQALRIAKAIVRERAKAPIVTTQALAELVAATIGRSKGGIHPATRVFQALRMHVNREVENLERALQGGLEVLAPGGRFVVITFESLTDRIVKQFFAAHCGRMESLQQGGAVWRGDLPQTTFVSRKAIKGSDEEIASNPRARSAKLRAVIKV